jgi:D-glycero-D-manno-heptose 1,7-bisphosphate phosphatase
VAPTAFLDRDGTINAKATAHRYVTAPAELVLLPRAAEAVARLNRAGWRAIVVTNQRGVATGELTEADLDAIHGRLEAELARYGAHLDGIYSCPHAEGACDCRKPGTGLFERARADHPGIDFAESVVIGDSWRDMEAAVSLGSRRVLVGAETEPGAVADHRAASLWEAVDWLLRRPSAT